MAAIIKKKVVLLGSFAVGKTSLIGRFVRNIFSEKYLTTVGVKVDRKVVSVDGIDTTMLVWDVNGSESVGDIRPAYLTGMAGYVLVIDCTRIETLRAGVSIASEISGRFGDLPHIVLLNKSDLVDQSRVTINQVHDELGDGGRVVRTSAKTGSNVEDAFATLASLMTGGD